MTRQRRRLPRRPPPAWRTPNLTQLNRSPGRSRPRWRLCGQVHHAPNPATTRPHTGGTDRRDRRLFRLGTCPDQPLVHRSGDQPPVRKPSPSSTARACRPCCRRASYGGRAARRPSASRSSPLPDTSRQLSGATGSPPEAVWRSPPPESPSSSRA